MIRNRLLILAIGSNSHSWNNVRHAKRLIQQSFPSLVVYSSTILTEPIGIGGKHFRNCLATMTTDLSLEEVTQRIKRIEAECGNTAEKRTRNIIEMDIDILLHAGRRHHQNDWQRPYIQQLLRELFPKYYIKEQSL